MNGGVVAEPVCKGRLQPQAGDEGDRPRELAALVEHFERCVGPIGHGHDLPLWVAPPYDQE
jgi:hypothetical protein